MRQLRFAALVSATIALVACASEGPSPASRGPDPATDAVARQLIRCLISYEDAAAMRRVPPHDFERMLVSFCLQEKGDFRVAAVGYFHRIGVTDPVFINAKATEQIEKLERLSVGNYAQRFYQVKPR